MRKKCRPTRSGSFFLRFSAVVVAGIVFVVPARAQWASDIRGMFKQLAALEAYLQTAEKGYKIAEDGLHAIRDIKNGEFSLHSTFFTSLKAVSPTVSRLLQIGEIISLESDMVAQLRSTIIRMQNSGLVTPAELSHLNDIYALIVKIGTDDISFVQSILADGSFSMTDGERIYQIAEINNRTKSTDRYVQSLIAETDLLAVERQQALTDATTLQSIYKIK